MDSGTNSIELIEQLEQELEDVAIGILVAERLGRGGFDDDIPLDELARQIAQERLF